MQRAMRVIIARQANAQRNQDIAIHGLNRIETLHGIESAGPEPQFPTTGLPDRLPNEMSSDHRPAWKFCAILRALFKTGDSRAAIDLVLLETSGEARPDRGRLPRREWGAPRCLIRVALDR